MNAIIYTILKTNDLEHLEKIATAIHLKDFTKAETILITLLEELTAREYNTQEELADALKTANTLYSTFNIFYQSLFSDISSLESDLHENVLIAHMSDPESMDDLMYEVVTYLKDFENDDQHDEAVYHLDCYRGIHVG
jgi:hypothetical protein